MAEYIEREVAFNALKDAAEREYKNRRYREKNAMDEARLIISHLPAAFEDAQVGPIPAADVVERASGIIGVIPAADVREVVRGKWMWLGDCSNEGLYCSVCKNKIHETKTPKKKLSNFCPNCGADMREES